MRRHMDPDIRLCALYEFKLGHNSRIACDNLARAYGEKVVSIHTVMRWFRKYRRGNENTMQETYSKVNDVELKQLMDEYPHIGIPELARYFGVTYPTIKCHIDSVNRGIYRKYVGDKPHHTKKKNSSSAFHQRERLSPSRSPHIDVRSSDGMPKKEIVSPSANEKLIRNDSDDFTECLTYFS